MLEKPVTIKRNLDFDLPHTTDEKTLHDILSDARETLEMSANRLRQLDEFVTGNAYDSVKPIEDASGDCMMETANHILGHTQEIHDNMVHLSKSMGL